MELEYEELEMNNGDFSESSTERLNALLTIRKDGNVIYLCHPRHLFDTLLENPDTKEIESVDFDSINVERMLSINDFGRYSIVEQICCRANNQFTYLMRKSSHMIKKYRNQGATQFSYPFAILEECYDERGQVSYFVRGIICCNQTGFKVAFNPAAIKELPKESIWEKALRFGDNHNI